MLKTGRCHRGTEQGGKQGAHPGNGDDMQVLLVEPDQAAQGCADAAANLQRCALPPGGAATQMGQTVPMKISGVIFRGISFCVRMELSTRFVPSSWAMPHSRYRATMTSPASGSK